MAHTQYPFLVKHEFMQWAESWKAHKDSLPQALRWKGFFVNMVFAIAFLMTKARMNGPVRSQAFYNVATTKYLPFLTTWANPVVKAQAYLILALYALHMPSTENIIALSSWTIRYCVMAQLHLAETEPAPVSRDAQIQIQVRRRVFWCAYTLDRAVCSSYDFPCCVPDHHITVANFANVDDDELFVVASSLAPGSQMVGSSGVTNVSSALHIFAGRKIESEIQEVTLGKDFVPHSEESFRWRSTVLDKLKEWDRLSKASSDLSQKGYVSLPWLSMIYHYNLVTLYRPTTRAIVRGIAGDWSVQACSQALLLFRKFQMAREIAQPWLGLLTQFQIGVTLLYCFWATPPQLWRDSYRSADVPDAVRACSSTLAIFAERWTEAECLRDVFETLAREIPLGESWPRPKRMTPAGVATVESSLPHTTQVVVHRPVLRMIREMATEDFPVDDRPVMQEMDLDDDNPPPSSAIPALAPGDDDGGGMGLQWAEHSFPGPDHNWNDMPAFLNDDFMSSYEPFHYKDI
ncbi:hypothetical protein A1O1_09109 [Capronia coronata CBS 617.96]|uniref:Xylanolytic transcriptional activator regulatory domain-containing protein n=1 Tax=Capronia coronata CBS 617.96 TaxID=1182541 RepID=W9XE10_9EURO|nr:uncharacterized protein A1O1_09109 [Capronia coronata CBS 617.96]EXJ78707.1 hypothetical protein A1O1_09109 [Capronia coronata CBS 617.96]